MYTQSFQTANNDRIIFVSCSKGLTSTISNQPTPGVFLQISSSQQYSFVANDFDIIRNHIAPTFSKSSFPTTQPENIVLENIMLEDGRLLVFMQPIIICPTTAEDECLTADIDEFEIYLWGENRDALINDFKANMGFAWDKYACALDEELSEEALEFKKRLLARIQEKPNR